MPPPPRQKMPHACTYPLLPPVQIPEGGLEGLSAATEEAASTRYFDRRPLRSKLSFEVIRV